MRARCPHQIKRRLIQRAGDGSQHSRLGTERNIRVKSTVWMLILVAGLSGLVNAQTELPDGYMGVEESQAIVDKTVVIILAPELSGLSANERAAVHELIKVGRIFQALHEKMRHYQAIDAYNGLLTLDHELGSPPATQNLIHMYYQFKGPVGRMLDNKSRAFLPVDSKTPGRNVYPWGIERAELDEYFEKFPDRRESLLGVRSVVRRSESSNIEADLATIDEYPCIGVLHPGFRDLLARLKAGAGDMAFYACPYSVAFAEHLTDAYALLNRAADLMDGEDSEFAGYLRNRARDLLSGNYESGDASWVTGKFDNLNAEIGSYEVYDDQLYGVKSFFALNVLLRDQEQSDVLREAIQGMQAFENSLPYEPAGWDGAGDKKKVREDIPVGVYNIIADFGQSRGTNTATILPNESEFARKYGRVILMRHNILNDPDLFAARRDKYQSVVARTHQKDLTPEGGFYRTLWHEIGHYLGVDRTADGRELGAALESSANKLEELKADLVSLFLVETLRESGYYSEEAARSVYADGVRRVLLKNKPAMTQTYAVMQLMQFNYYLEKGLFEYNHKNNRLVIRHQKYHQTVAAMLAEVLALQQDGDKVAADAFIKKYIGWDDVPHAALAESMKAAEKYRYAVVRYAVLENK